MTEFSGVWAYNPNAAALDGAVVVDGKGKIREIGCIFPTGRARIVGEGARTRAAAFASKSGIALKVSQDGEISVFKSGKSLLNVFAPVR